MASPLGSGTLFSQPLVAEVQSQARLGRWKGSRTQVLIQASEEPNEVHTISIHILQRD